MIITNFDLQNQPLERGVVSQPLALPRGSLHEGGREHHTLYPSLCSAPQPHPSSQALLSLFNLKAETIQGKGILGEG